MLFVFMMHFMRLCLFGLLQLSGASENTRRLSFADKSSHCYKRLLQLSGASGNTRRLIFADESGCSMEEVLAILRAMIALPARMQGLDGQGATYILLFLNGAGEIILVHGTIGQSTDSSDAQQYSLFIQDYSNCVGQ